MVGGWMDGWVDDGMMIDTGETKVLGEKSIMRSLLQK
jgi:hypothetical protein